MLKPSYAICLLLWVLSNSLTLVRDLSYSHDQDHIHVHQIANTTIRSQNKTPSSIMSLSPRLSSRIWAIQKEIKDAYPKKVCHMPKRHVKKKEKKEKRCIPKEGMPHVHKTCRKKEEKKKNIAHAQEKNTKKRDGSYEGVHPLCTKNIPHTCTSWSDCMTLLGSCFWLNNITKQTCPFIPTLSST